METTRASYLNIAILCLMICKLFDAEPQVRHTIQLKTSKTLFI